MREFLQTFTSLATFALVTLAAALLVTAVEVAAGALEVVLARLFFCGSQIDGIKQTRMYESVGHALTLIWCMLWTVRTKSQPILQPNKV